MSSACKKYQQGAVLIWFAFLFPTILATFAIAVDIGTAIYTKQEFKKVINFAALSASMKLHPDLNASADDRANIARLYIKNHPVSGITIDNIVVSDGHWDYATETFQEDTLPLNALKISVVAKGEFNFITVFNSIHYNASVNSIVTIEDPRPLNINVLFDSSTNMSLASQLNGINYSNGDYQFNISSQEVNTRLLTIYNQLVDLNTSSHPPYGGLTTVYQSLTSDKEQIKQDLGLNSVPYPYTGNGASWDDYINYVKFNIPASYQNQYSALSLINYWEAVTYTAEQVPDLKSVSEYPLIVIKNNITYFVNKLGSDDEINGFIRLNVNTLQASSTNKNNLSSLIGSLQAGQTVDDNADAFTSLLSSSIQSQISDYFSQSSLSHKRVVLVICTFTKCADLNNLSSKATAIKDYTLNQDINLYFLELGVPSGSAEYNAVENSYGGLGSFLGANSTISTMNFSDSEFQYALDNIVKAMERTIPHIAYSDFFDPDGSSAPPSEN